MFESLTSFGPIRSTARNSRRHLLIRYRIRWGDRLKPILIRRQVQLLLDGLGGALAVYLAYQLRFDLHIPAVWMSQMWIWTAVVFFLEPFALWVGGGYRSTWQHFNTGDLIQMVVRLACVSGLLFCFSGISTPNQPHHLIPYGVIACQFMLAVASGSGLRLLRRFDHEATQRLLVDERILIVATAATVSAAVRQLQPLYANAITGLILADNERYQDLSIAGIPVLGNLSQLRLLLAQQHASLLFVCSADLIQTNEVIETAAEMNVTVKLLPSVHDLLNNRVQVMKKFSTTSVHTSGREHSMELHPLVADCLRGRTVLVTGAAGSIGSEIARQVMGIPAGKLLLLDQDENGVFELLGELGTKNKQLRPVIADIRDADSIRRIFATEKIDVVLHAAAYKHVPLMEANPCEAVLNNALGTRLLAQAAVDFGVERFVMISSDKAVRPSSVMGASKRLAEVIIQGMAAASPATQFACVRFGNVLGSRGSVLPIFLKQIEQGGPLTITNEQMTRYFMTIPQAVRLVLQAASLASCGHIYMLDMGDPVRIINLAREVIRLAGLTPDKDIEISIVGSRPGEKLHEQLWSDDAEVTPTPFEHVFEVKAECAGENFAAMLENLERTAQDRDAVRVREILHEMPIDYRSERAIA